LAKVGRIVPALLDEELTATYAGLRAATEHSDYCIALDPSQRILTLGGIRSTGLTASMAIAEEAVEHLASAGLVLARRAQHVAITMPNLGEASDRPWMTGGRIVCHCEKVTEDEIVGACVSTVPPVDLDGLRRRTRVLMGRCQGFFCGAEVRSMLERETA
jgi:glycerol-3-phosphate dehydrogenase